MRAAITNTAAAMALLALAGCQGSFDDWAPKAEKRLPDEVIETLKTAGMTRKSPIMVRIFKQENVLEIWKQKDNGRYGYVKSYEICKWSGKLGPKFREGDRQAPEGFYNVRPAQMNPKSSYHLAFNIGYPNTYDRSNGRTGSHLMVHGACSSAGCYSMTDDQVEEIYAFARDSFRGGQTDFQIQAYPFRMTPENMAKNRNNRHFDFWTMLKEGYDHFEITKVPPKVDVCDRQYVFNKLPVEGQKFQPTNACPETGQPEKLRRAYRIKQRQFEAAFATEVAKLEGRAPRNPDSIDQQSTPASDTTLTTGTVKRPEAPIITGTTPTSGTTVKALGQEPPAKKNQWLNLLNPFGS